MPAHQVRRKQTRSELKNYDEKEATSIIVESLLLGQPDDMTMLPNGGRIDRNGFP